MISRKVILGAAGNTDSYWVNVITRGTAQQQVYMVASTSDTAKNVYACGYNYSNDGVLGDGIIMKFNSDGALLWKTSILKYNTYDFTFNTIKVDSSNNIYVAGYYGFNNQPVVFKYDSTGTRLWGNTYGTRTGLDLAFNSSQTPYLLSNYYSSSASRVHVHILNSSNGDNLSSPFGSGQTDYTSIVPCSMSIDTNNNVWVLAYRANYMIVFKYDSSGTLLFDKRLANSWGWYGPGMLALDTSNNAYITQVGDGSRYYITKLDSSGSVQWTQYISGFDYQYRTNNAGFHGVVTDTSGNVYVSMPFGKYDSTNYTWDVNAYSVYLFKLNPAGTVQWQRKLYINNGYNFTANKLSIDSSNNLILAASFYPISASATNGYIFKLPSDGSRTGTYGDIVYTTATMTFTSDTSTSPSASSGYFSNGYTPLSSAASATSATPTETSTTIKL